MNLARRSAKSVFVLFLLSGCGAAEMVPPPQITETVSFNATEPSSVFSFQEAQPGRAASSSESTSNPDAVASSQDRKIIYNTHLRIRVESFDGVGARIVDLSQQAGGYVAGASTQGMSGEQRSGIWTIRIPVAAYRDFLNAAEQLGEVLSRMESTREVTGEFYDIEARIRNKQTEEQRLIKLLENKDERLENILTVEREITRVRGEVEQLQGKIRLLRDQTELSTVRLEISEVEEYVPVETPTFATQVHRQWKSTIDGISGAGQSIVLTAIRLGPWLLILLVAALPMLIILRRQYHKWRLRNPIA